MEGSVVLHSSATQALTEGAPEVLGMGGGEGETLNQESWIKSGKGASCPDGAGGAHSSFMSLELGIRGRSVSGLVPEKQMGHHESCLREVGMGGSLWENVSWNTEGVGCFSPSTSSRSTGVMECPCLPKIPARKP